MTFARGRGVPPTAMTIQLCFLASLLVEPPAAVAPVATPPTAAAPVATPPVAAAPVVATPPSAAAPAATPPVVATPSAAATPTTAEPVVTTPTVAPAATTPAAAPAATGAAVVTTTTTTTTTTATPLPPKTGYVHVPFDIGLVPGLSLNGRHKGKKVRNTFSMSFGWSRATRVDGMAVAMGAVIVDEHMQGIAASMGANITRGIHRGLQFSHVYNYAGELRGVQHAAINKAGRVQGLQIGLVNVGGDVRGAQIGLINWAKSADASIGLIPVTKEGGVRFEVSTSDTALLNVGLRLPARHTYTFIAAGLHPFGTKHGHVGTNYERGKAWEFGGGFGGHIPVTDAVFIDIDLSLWGVTSGLRQGAALGGMGKLRTMVGWQAAKHLAIFGGPTLNVLVDQLDPAFDPLAHNEVGVRTGKVDRPGYGWVAYQRTFEDVRLRVWPGFVAGLRF